MTIKRLMMTLLLSCAVAGCSLLQTANSLPTPETPDCPVMRPVTFEIYEPGVKINELPERVYGLSEEEVKRLLHYLLDLEHAAGCDL